MKKKQIEIEIPDGWEVGNISGPHSDSETTCEICVELKKLPVKDFAWYVRMYGSSPELCSAFSSSLAIIISYIRDGRYDSVPFEIKIGLLKFICDDIGVNWRDFSLLWERNPLAIKLCNTIGGDLIFGDKVLVIEKICPTSFLKSTLDGK